MIETKTRRLSVILRLTAQGAPVTPAEHRRLVAKNLVHPDGVVTAAGAELIEDLGPLPVRDVQLAWSWCLGAFVTEHNGYRGVVTDHEATVYGSPDVEEHRPTLYRVACGTIAGGRTLASDWIRRTENNTADALGL